MAVDKMMPSGPAFAHVLEELRLRRVFNSRYSRHESARLIGSAIPDYVAEPHDVRLRNVPTRLTDWFYARWQPEGLVKVLWVFRLDDGPVTDDHRVIARFDNPAGALLFHIAEHGGRHG